EAAVHDHAQPGAHVPHRPPELRARGAVSVRFLPAGDLAVLVEFDEEISVEVTTRVRALELLIRQKGLTGVVETAPTLPCLLAYSVGCTPGLPYMTGMPERLTIPRLETPRTKTPAGSVGIGGTQCCVYSVDSPGGFWVLGRTPLRLYDPESPEPVLLRPGDRVSFRAIDRGEYDTIAARVAARAYAPV